MKQNDEIYLKFHIKYKTRELKMLSSIINEQNFFELKKQTNNEFMS